METEIKILLRCADCARESEINPGDMGFGVEVAPCPDHGAHAYANLTVICPNCEKENLLLVGFGAPPEE